MRYQAAVVLAAVIMFCAAPAYSHGGGVQVEVVADNGGRFETLPFRDFEERGTRVIKRYLEARRGENYSILVTNNMPERVAVVIAADGRNVITGRKSYLANNERMYIVNPHSATRLEGWRTDSNTVHRFYFTDIRDSYSVRTFGDTSALGVIAVAVYREKDRPEMLSRSEMTRQKAPAPSRGASKESDGRAAGTGFGDSTYSPVIEVAFEPESVPAEKVLIKYEWHDELCRKGIINCRWERHNRLWDEGAFAPLPPGYQGR